MIGSIKKFSTFTATRSDPQGGFYFIWTTSKYTHYIQMVNPADRWLINGLYIFAWILNC